MWSLLRRTFTNLGPNEESSGCCLFESMILFGRSQFSVYIPLDIFWASFVLNEREVTFPRGESLFSSLKAPTSFQIVNSKN